MLKYIIIFFIVLEFYLNDKLIKYQYLKYNDEWISDGKPTGFFWRPKEIPLFSGHFARNLRLSDWFFFTPEWIKNDRYALFLLWCNRLTAIPFLLILIWVIIE